MSKIIAKDHLKTRNWEVIFNNLAPTFADLFIGFTEEPPVVEFKDLRFKYELKQSGNIKQYGVYPPAGVKYVRSDQPYIVSDRLNLEMGTEYELYLWAENGKQAFDTTVTFTTPRSAQPYPSWTWDYGNQVWQPPMPYPDNGNPYYWDEETQAWVAEAEDTATFGAA